MGAIQTLWDAGSQQAPTGFTDWGDAITAVADKGYTYGGKVAHDTAGTPTFAHGDYPDLRAVFVKVWGAGGGSGGTEATGGSDAAEASGGGGGGYSEKLILVSALATSETVTVGAGGAKGAVGNNPGSPGGSSSFGAHLSATGGGSGDGCPTTSGQTRVVPGNYGQGSGGDLNLRGSAGGPGRVYNGAASASFTNVGGTAAHGGQSSSFLGQVGSGAAGHAPGGGAAGARSNASSQSAQEGGAGANGRVEILLLY